MSHFGVTLILGIYPKFGFRILNLYISINFVQI